MRVYIYIHTNTLKTQGQELRMKEKRAEESKHYAYAPHVM